MNRDGSPITRMAQPPQRLVPSSATTASSSASAASGGMVGGGGGRQDAASILMMSLNIWHKGGSADHVHQQYGILSGRKKTRSTKSKAVSEKRYLKTIQTVKTILYKHIEFCKPSYSKQAQNKWRKCRYYQTKYNC